MAVCPTDRREYDQLVDEGEGFENQSDPEITLIEEASGSSKKDAKKNVAHIPYEKVLKE